ncbi:MAG TPA: acyl carrier protein [Spirochaetota bacterium]|jgi:acyl carrier protein|nr:acyl carrier protein [Spirochaetota bacterium]HOR45883.1 acyl carrier protein [Spirochaetota bacterium]HOU84404.1 acyl carrier protein [Spirochaetota bacterium]HPJ15174.1 acyl carrier protein [Spirochaetota bacterium]HPK57601.1 acyl carrier protein [Spirochaetota bacterium]
MVFEKIKGVVANQLGVEEGKIALETKFIEDLGADSLDLYQVIMNLEEQFGIEIPSEDAEKIKTVGDAVSYVESKKK